MTSSKRERIEKELAAHTEAELHDHAKLLKAKQELELAICDLPEDESYEYVQACRVSPALVERESNAAWFLKIEGFKAKPAAQRLTTYWRNRVKLFGDRAFYPMLDMSGIGALSDADIAFLKTGAVVQLADDALGRSVTCNDIGRLDEDARNTNDKEVRLRVTFYFFTKIAMENRVQQEVVSIRILRGDQFQLQQFNKSRFKLFQESFPVKLHNYHICCLPTAGSRKQFADVIIPATIKQMGKDLADIAKVHMADNSSKMARKLAKCGLHRSGLPSTLGGTWSYEDYLSRNYSTARNKDRKRCAESSPARKKKYNRIDEDQKMPAVETKTTSNGRRHQSVTLSDKAELQQALATVAAAKMQNQNLSIERQLQASFPSLSSRAGVASFFSQLDEPNNKTPLDQLFDEHARWRTMEEPVPLQVNTNPAVTSGPLGDLRRAAVAPFSNDQQAQQLEQRLKRLQDLQRLMSLQSSQGSTSQELLRKRLESARIQQQLEAANALALLGSRGVDAQQQRPEQRPAADISLLAAASQAPNDSALVARLRSLSQDPSALERTTQWVALIAALRRASQGSLPEMGNG